MSINFSREAEAVFLVVYDPFVNELWATNLDPVGDLSKVLILEFLVRSDPQKVGLVGDLCRTSI